MLSYVSNQILPWSDRKQHPRATPIDQSVSWRLKTQCKKLVDRASRKVCRFMRCHLLKRLERSGAVERLERLELAAMYGE
jgi:hypothetical protein